MKKILCILAILMLAGCSSGLDRKLDGSSELAYAASLAGMKKSSKPAEVARLDEALLMLAIADVSIGYEGGILGAVEKLSASKTPEQLADALLPVVNGKTGHELIAAGKKRMKTEAARQLVKVDPELARLRKARDERGAVKGVLDAIQVFEPSLRFSGNAGQPSSLIEFKVKNGTELPLRHLYFRGSASEAGGGKLLYADDINYKLSEALPPGETKTIRLPNMAADKWNAPELWGRENLSFTVEVVNAESMPGTKLAPAFSHRDAQRLLVLEKEKPLLDKMAAD